MGKRRIGKDYSFIGGLVGYDNYGVISSSYATGNVSYTGTVNPNWGGSSAALQSKVEVGGLIGGGGAVSNSYATGSVSATTASTDASYLHIGGLGGSASENGISNSYSMGTVSGPVGSGANVGGLVGYIYATQNGSVSNSVWNTSGYAGTTVLIQNASPFTSTTAQASAHGITGLDNSGMKTASNFSGAGWSTSIWNLTDGSYPRLSWTVPNTYTAPTPNGSASSILTSVDIAQLIAIQRNAPNVIIDTNAQAILAAIDESNRLNDITTSKAQLLADAAAVIMDKSIIASNPDANAESIVSRYAAGSTLFNTNINVDKPALAAAISVLYGVKTNPFTATSILNTISSNANYAIMSNIAYGDTSLKLPQNIKDMTPYIGAIYNSTNPATGFSANIFLDTSTKQMTIAYRGSANAQNFIDDSGLLLGAINTATPSQINQISANIAHILDPSNNFSDLSANIQGVILSLRQTTGNTLSDDIKKTITNSIISEYTNKIYKEAADYARQIQAEINKENINNNTSSPLYGVTLNFTGQSLGGGLATYAAAATGALDTAQTPGSRQIVATFDSAPIPDALNTVISEKAGAGQILNFRSSTDPLTAIDNASVPMLIGKTITVENSAGDQGTLLIGHSPFDIALAMKNVQDVAPYIGK